MIKYIGSKRALLERICGLSRTLLPSGGRVCDLFSGGARVGHALKAQGFRVHANDHNAYAHTLAVTHVQADAERWQGPAERLIAELSETRPQAGWFTKAYCEDARYFHPDNGARIDAIRERIAALSLEPELEAIAVTALIQAADKVDSTAGVQMAYMKRWAARALKPLALKVPDLLPGQGLATRADAEEIAPQVEADLVYLDPPYNQHSYLGNYHVWESLTLWDKPETYGVANKRSDVKTRKSAFNRRGTILPALERVIDGLKAPNLIVSFNDEGFVDREAMEALLASRGHVTVIETPRPRYVGARIGIHNLKGEKVGTVGRLQNVERLFIATERTIDLAEAA